jgi:hypothetical protein
MNPHPYGVHAVPCVTAAMLLLVLVAGADAQTLTDPYPRPNPPAAGKAAAAKHMKACPEYGAGFYRVDGTNTCVKIGGFVDGSVSGGNH